MNRRLNALNKELGIHSDGFKTDSEVIKRKVNNKLNADLRERKLYMKNKLIKGSLIAASLTVLFSATALAVSPAGQEAISSIMSYFQNDKAKEVTDIEELEKYNEEIGQSVTKNGYTLTLDNVAADDNFVHIFYTIKSHDKPFYSGDDSDYAYINNMLYVQGVIEGKLQEAASANSYDGYFADPYTYKAVEKHNISGNDIPDNFKIELFGCIIDDKGDCVIYNMFDKNGNLSISDEDKDNIWYISAVADKSKVSVESVTKNIDKELPWIKGAKLDKVVFSPFANQIVLTTEKGTPESDMGKIDSIAMFDENGNSLDLIDKGLSYGVDGSSKNSFEFLKADKNTKSLKLVPFEYVEHGDMEVLQAPVGQYPLSFEVNDYGKVVITDIRTYDGEIAIDYYEDGVVPYNPGFILMDKDGGNAEPGGKHCCTLYTDVHYNTNSYTARYVYEVYDDNGCRIKDENMPKKEELAQRLKSIGVYESRWFALDFDNALTVDLK